VHCDRVQQPWAGCVGRHLGYLGREGPEWPKPVHPNRDPLCLDWEWARQLLPLCRDWEGLEWPKPVDANREPLCLDWEWARQLLPGCLDRDAVRCDREWVQWPKPVEVERDPVQGDRLWVQQHWARLQQPVELPAALAGES